MKKPRLILNSHVVNGYNNAILVLQNNLSPEQYISTHQDSSKRNTLAWPELYMLRCNMKIYGSFLLKFPLTLRRYIVMNEEIIGLSQQELYEKYGINFDLIGKFIGVKDLKRRYKSKPKVRNILPNPNFQKEFVSFISILARIPFDWINSEDPVMKWNVDHFHFLVDPKMTKEEFTQYINSINYSQNDTRGIIVCDEKLMLYIRLEIQSGGFIIELFNKQSPLSEIIVLLESIQITDKLIGYMPTVIPGQTNFAMVYKNQINKTPVCLPMEFKMLHF